MAIYPVNKFDLSNFILTYSSLMGWSWLTRVEDPHVCAPSFEVAEGGRKATNGTVHEHQIKTFIRTKQEQIHKN
jgi:hypothetical protein